MERIVGYNWELYYDSTLLHEDFEVYETEEDAREAAKYEINEQIETWKAEDGWHPEYCDDKKYFDIVINEVTEEM